MGNIYHCTRLGLVIKERLYSLSQQYWFREDSKFFKGLDVGVLWAPGGLIC